MQKRFRMNHPSHDFLSISSCSPLSLALFQSPLSPSIFLANFFILGAKCLARQSEITWLLPFKQKSLSLFRLSELTVFQRTFSSLHFRPERPESEFHGKRKLIGREKRCNYISRPFNRDIIRLPFIQILVFTRNILKFPPEIRFSIKNLYANLYAELQFRNL